MEKASIPSSKQLAAAPGQPNSHDRPAGHEGKPPAQAAFTSAAIGMSWQLAAIVLLPIIGGYKLDQITGRTPLLTLIGLMLGLAGSILVVRRALTLMNNFEVPHDS